MRGEQINSGRDAVSYGCSFFILNTKYRSKGRGDHESDII